MTSPIPIRSPARVVTVLVSSTIPPVIIAVPDHRVELADLLAGAGDDRDRAAGFPVGDDLVRDLPMDFVSRLPWMRIWPRCVSASNTVSGCSPVRIALVRSAYSTSGTVRRRPCSSATSWMKRWMTSTGGDVGPAGGEVEHPAPADGGELVPVPDQRDPRPGLVGDGEQRAGGVLVEHPRLVNQDQITMLEPHPVAGTGVDAAGLRVGITAVRRVQVPSLVPAEPVLRGRATPRNLRRAPTSRPAAAWAAFNVGVTTTSRWPCSVTRLRVARQEGGLAGAGRALDHDQRAVAGQRGDGGRLPGIQTYP